MSLKDFIYQYLYPWQKDKFSHYQEDKNKLLKKNPSFNPKKHALCPSCLGKGTIRRSIGLYDMEDFECSNCAEEGWVYLTEWAAIFSRYKADSKAKLLEEKRIKNELTRIKKKITKQELAFLLKYRQ